MPVLRLALFAFYMHLSGVLFASASREDRVIFHEHNTLRVYTFRK